MTAGWYAGVMQMLKEPPALKDLLILPPTPPQTNEEMVAAMQAWMAITRH